MFQGAQGVFESFKVRSHAGGMQAELGCDCTRTLTHLGLGQSAFESDLECDELLPEFTGDLDGHGLSAGVAKHPGMADRRRAQAQADHNKAENRDVLSVDHIGSTGKGVTLALEAAEE